MANTATITFYNVKACGLYRGLRGREPEFGELSSILSDLNEWGSGQFLEETKTFDPSEDSDLFPVYLADIATHNGDWLVAMWNEVPESEGGIAAVTGRSQVGSPSVEITEKIQGTIPGFATYFWFIPERDILATVRIQRPFTGQQAMQLYMENFIRYYCSHVVHDTQTIGSDNVAPVGYVRRSGEQPMSLHAKFRTELCRLPSKVEELAADAERIYKVAKRETVSLLSTTERARWERIGNFFNLPSLTVDNRKKARLEYITDITMNREEVIAAYEEWISSNGAENGTNIGFKLKGSTGFIWFSGSIARDEIDVDLSNTTPEFYDPSVLLRSLSRHKERLIRMLDR